MLVTCERKWSGDVENQMDQGTKLQFLLVSVDANIFEGGFFYQAFFWRSGIKKNILSLNAHGLGLVFLVSQGCEGKLENQEGMPMEEGGPCKYHAKRQRDRESNPQPLCCETHTDRIH